MRLFLTSQTTLWSEINSETFMKTPSNTLPYKQMPYFIYKLLFSSFYSIPSVASWILSDKPEWTKDSFFVLIPRKQIQSKKHPMEVVCWEGKPWKCQGKGKTTNESSVQWISWPLRTRAQPILELSGVWKKVCFKVTPLGNKEVVSV